MGNVGFSRREQFQQGDGQTFSGTTYGFDKRAGAIIGIQLNLSDAATITWHVSQDNSAWYPITPPFGTSFWAAPGTDAIAIPAEWLAFLAPYAYARMTFSASQTGAVCIIAKMA